MTSKLTHILTTLLLALGCFGCTGSGGGGSTPEGPTTPEVEIQPAEIAMEVTDVIPAAPTTDDTVTVQFTVRNIAPDLGKARATSEPFTATVQEILPDGSEVLVDSWDIPALEQEEGYLITLTASSLEEREYRLRALAIVDDGDLTNNQATASFLVTAPATKITSNG